MTEDLVKTKKVTFKTGLPNATHATFVHDGETWFAYPQKKSAAVFCAMDKMLGAIGSIRDDLILWMNAHPQDAARAVKIMARADKAMLLAKDKVEAWTM